MKKLIAALVLAMLSGIASAQNMTVLTWVNATTNTDGSPAQLRATRVYRSGGSDQGPWYFLSRVDVAQTTYIDLAVTNGTYWYYVQHVSDKGVRGVVSLVVDKSFGPPTPGPATSLTAN